MTFETVAVTLATVAAVGIGAALVSAIHNKRKRPDRPFYDVDAPVMNPETTPTIFRAGIRLGPRAYVSNDEKSYLTVTVISVNGDLESYNDDQTVTYMAESLENDVVTVTESVSDFLTKYTLIGTARNDSRLQAKSDQLK